MINMINEKIIEMIEGIGIPCYYRHAPKTLDDFYCLFQIYNETDSSVYDDSSHKTTYLLMVNFWCKGGKYLDKYIELKNLFKSYKHNIKIRQITDLEDDEYYGKSFNITFVEWDFQN